MSPSFSLPHPYDGDNDCLLPEVTVSAETDSERHLSILLQKRLGRARRDAFWGAREQRLEEREGGNAAPACVRLSCRRRALLLQDAVPPAGSTSLRCRCKLQTAGSGGSLCGRTAGRLDETSGAQAGPASGPPSKDASLSGGRAVPRVVAWRRSLPCTPLSPARRPPGSPTPGISGPVFSF